MPFQTVLRFSYEAFGIEQQENIAGSKHRIHSDPRALACKIVYEHFMHMQRRFTLSEIAYLYGFKQHSGVIHAIKKANRLIETDKNIKLYYNRIKIKMLTHNWKAK